MREGGDKRGSEVREGTGLVAIGAREPDSLGPVRSRGGSKSSDFEEMRRGRGRGDRTELACHKNGQDREECTAVPSENRYGKLRGSVDRQGARIEGLKVVVDLGENDSGGDLKSNSSGLEKEGEQDDDSGGNDYETPVLRSRALRSSSSSCSNNDRGGMGRGEGGGLQVGVLDGIPSTPKDGNEGTMESPRLPADFKSQKARHEMFKKRGGEGRRLSWRRKRVGLDPRRDLNAILQQTAGEFKSPPHDDPFEGIDVVMDQETLREESEEP